MLSVSKAGELNLKWKCDTVGVNDSYKNSYWKSLIIDKLWLARPKPWPSIQL